MKMTASRTNKNDYVRMNESEIFAMQIHIFCRPIKRQFSL